MERANRSDREYLEKELERDKEMRVYRESMDTREGVDMHGDRDRDRERRDKPRRTPSPPRSGNPGDEPLKNGCCRQCMKAFSETKKACLCQVPMDVRLGHLPESGCRVCGCHGCHPEEKTTRRSSSSKGYPYPSHPQSAYGRPPASSRYPFDPPPPLIIL